MQDKIETYFLVSRFIFDSAIWSNDPHRLKLFIWLIGNARHSETPKQYPGVTVKQGELLTSYSNIIDANEYLENNKVKRWSPARVSRMMHNLEDNGYITMARDTYGTHVIVCNYKIYQDKKHYARNTCETPAKQLVIAAKTNKHDKHYNHTKDLKDSCPDPEKPESEPKKRKTIKYDKYDMQLARLLKNLITKNYPKHKAETEEQLENWANKCRLMREIDKRDNIEQVLRWTQDDSFWYKNILSMDKLRKQYESLELKMTDNKRETSAAPINFENTDYGKGDLPPLEEPAEEE